MVLHDMHAIEHTYVSLLADVARLTGFSEIRGSYEGLQWCLTEAPKLEKLVLEYIEFGRDPELDRFPTWLQRLVAASVKDAVSLRYLRQLLLFCYKALVTHDKVTTEKAYKDFICTNSVVGKFGNSLAGLSPCLLDDARRQCQSVLFPFRESEVIPSHGPGAVTTSKERWLHRYSTIECLYPYSDWYCMQNMQHQSSWEDAQSRDIISAKLIAVPKDSRGPRLICVHPAEAIWIQQGVRRELERVIMLKRRSIGPWPHGRIRFNDQSVNAAIALNSSRTRRYATIDMKEASDRISDVLVQILFGRKYKFFGCSRASEYTISPAGSKTTYRGNMYSYAPMGNATTFPVQSLVFWSICVATLRRLGFHQPGAAFVFGDDICVPSETVEAVIDGLESFGLLVNRTKSFWRGAFRESCGTDAFNGVDVTPVRWKTTIDAEHPTGLQSLSDIAMRLRIAGYEDAAVMTYRTLRTRLYNRYGHRLFLTNRSDHGGIAEFSYNEHAVWADAYWHKHYQWFHSHVWRLEDQVKVDPVHDWNHVLESVCSLERTAHSSIPQRSFSRRVRLNRGWMALN